MELVVDVTELEVCPCDAVEETCVAFVADKKEDVLSVVHVVVVAVDVDSRVRLDEEDGLIDKAVL